MTDRILSWERDVPLLTHPAIIRSIAKLWIITGLLVLALVGGLIGIQEGIRTVVPIAAMILVIIGGLFVLSLLVMLVVFGNRMRMSFTIDDRGITARVIDIRAKTANRLAAMVGALAGRPGAAGAGMIAASDEERSAVWPAIVRASYDQWHHTITLRNAWRPVLLVFCTPEIYQDAAGRIAGHLAGARTTSRPRSNPLWRTLALTLLVIVAVLPLFGMPHTFAPNMFAIIFTLCFALATVWLVPLMGWAVLGGVAWIGGTILVQGLASQTNQFSGRTSNGFESFVTIDWIGFTVTCAGLAVLAGLAIAALLGRVVPMLARDTNEMEGGAAS